MGEGGMPCLAVSSCVWSSSILSMFWRCAPGCTRGTQAWALNGLRAPRLAVLTDGSDHPSGKEALVQPGGGARKGSVPVPNAAADGGASLSGRPITLRGAIWQSSWQGLPCSMNAGDGPGLEWIRDAAKVAGGTNNHLVSRPLLILPHWQGRASANHGEAELSMTRSDRHIRMSSLLWWTSWRGL